MFYKQNQQKGLKQAGIIIQGRKLIQGKLKLNPIHEEFDQV